jgi:foldase protein PrsA
MAKKHKAAPKLDVSKHVTRRRLARWEKERRRRRIYTAAGILVIVLVVVIVAVAYAGNTTEGEMWVTSVGDVDFHGSDYANALYLCELGLYNATANQTENPILLLETSELVRQGAEEFGIPVTDTEVTQVLRSMFQTENQSLTDEDFQQAYQEMLSNLGVDDNRFRELIEVELLQLKLDQYLRAQIPNSSMHVYLEAISMTSEEEALAAGARIFAGENFSYVGQNYTYNELGWFPRGIIYPDIEEVAFSLEVGGVSDPIHITNPDAQTDYYYLIKVDAKEKRVIEDNLSEQLKSTAYPGWFAMQQDEKVKRNPNLDLDQLYEWAMEQLIEQMG